MTNYIDGFVLPVPRRHLDTYQQVAEQVAAVWKEHGAVAYFESVGDELSLAGTRSFLEAVDARDDEVVIFGWVVFPSKEVRDRANSTVPRDERMEALVAPLTDPKDLVFDAARMVYGGFVPLVSAR
ncbi:MAG: DUF1428 domain-containing protein [Flavobacteriales bacterium]|nr:DUF1428 domain-containing protein [Flavobacteriales bacterium]